MNAYKRYCKRRDAYRLYQTFVIVGMARHQAQMVIAQPIGFNPSVGESRLAKLQKAMEIITIATNASEQILKLYSHAKR